MPVKPELEFVGDASAENVVNYYLSLHLNIVSISEQSLVTMKIVKPSHVKKVVQDEV